jgi:hypothetical protein
MLPSSFIVQYVGFSTACSAPDFLIRWMPFAQGFTRAGIRHIALNASQYGSKGWKPAPLIALMSIFSLLGLLYGFFIWA